MKNDEVAAHKSKKNTKQWCKGKVGVEHQPKCFVYGFGGDGRALACTVCGKQLAVWYRDFLNVPRPSWVDL